MVKFWAAVTMVKYIIKKVKKDHDIQKKNL